MHYIDPKARAIRDIRSMVTNIVANSTPVIQDTEKEYELAKRIRDVYASKCYKIKTVFKTTISTDGNTCFAVKRLSKCPYLEPDSLSCQNCERFVDFTATATGNGINFWCLSKDTIDEYSLINKDEK